MFKKLFAFLVFVCSAAFAQNLATVSGSNVQDLNGTKLANGQICFLGTDQSDNPISFQVGGGGQILKRGYCAQISNGVIASFTVPNPATTSPSGIYYRVTVKDTSTGLEVLRYTGVTFAGTTFNFDTYTPVLFGASFAPLTGTSVSGNLSVSGNVSATGTITGSNIPAGQLDTGTGTTNTLPKFTTGASGIVGNSSISDNGTTITATEPVSLGSNSLTAGAGTFTGNLTATAGQNTLAFYKANTTLFIDGIKYPCTGAGITSAYTALPSNGGNIFLGCDVTISSATLLTATAGKPLFLNLAGRTITCANTSGVCLKILKADAFPRDPMVIGGGQISYSGASTSITGLQIGDATHPATNILVLGLAVDNFITASSVGMDLNFVEDSHFDAISFGNNTLALQLDLFTNQNLFSDVWFQQNVNAVQATDVEGMTFQDCLVQSNTGTTAFKIVASTQNVTNVRIEHCHFENNGDNTTSGRQILFSAATGKSIFRVDLVNNVFNGGVNVNAGSFIYEASGGGALGSALFARNTYGWSNIRTGSGFIEQGLYTAESDNFPVPNVGLNLQNITNCDALGLGLILSDPTAGRTYQIYAGTTNLLQNDLVFRDCTTPGYIAAYNGNVGQWDFQNKSVKTTGNYQFSNLLFSATSPTISSGFGTSPSILSTNGTATFRINVGTGGTATTGVLGMPTAANGWNCGFTDMTTHSNFTQQTASTTTTVSVGGFNSAGTATAWTASDTLIARCTAY